MQRQNKWIGLAAIACLVSILLSCSKPVDAPLRIGSNTWVGYEPLYLAQELEYYSDRSIQIINYPSATEVTRAFRNGELEVAALTLDETLLLKQTEPAIQAFLIPDISNGADVLLAKPEIQNLPDLAGNRVGVETTALGAYILTRALNQAGLSPADVTIVSLGASEHEQAYKQGVVDAIVTFEPIRSALLNAGANKLFDSSQIPNEIVDVLVVRQDLLQKRADALRSLAQGWFQALNYTQENAEDAIRRMAARQETTPNEFAAALKLIDIPDLTRTQKLLSNADPSLNQGAQQLASIMLEQKLLQQAVSADGILSDAVVKTLPSP